MYILENQLDSNKSVFYSLSKVYGIGKTTSFKICKTLGFSANLKIKQLSKSQIKNLVFFIDNSGLKINDNLKQFKILSIQNLISIKAYRGLRKIKGLPVRGQRTKTNAKTSKKFKYYKMVDTCLVKFYLVQNQIY